MYVMNVMTRLCVRAGGNASRSRHISSSCSLSSSSVEQLMLDALPKTSATYSPTYLDLTYGEGKHSELLLSHSPKARVVASDCHRGSYKKAVASGSVTALRSWFSQLPLKLTEDAGVGLHSADAVVIDTGPSPIQIAEEGEWSGLDLSRNGRLDLRFDPDEQSPSASDVLRLADDYTLQRILRLYGGMVHSGRVVVNAIVEGRYMFKEYRTLEELREVLVDAADRMREGDGRGGEDVDTLARRLLADTHRALRTFVNDEYNELHFALKVVAENFLKPRTGVLILITRSPMEEAVESNIILYIKYTA